MDKNIFANYLEEIAMEIRAFSMNRAYLEDMYFSLTKAAKEFYFDALEEARIKLID